MKILNRIEIDSVSGGNSNPNFDLVLAAKEGALCGIFTSLPAFFLAGLVAKNAYYNTTTGATYTDACLFAALGVAMIPLSAAFDMTLAYYEVPANYIFY